MSTPPTTDSNSASNRLYRFLKELRGSLLLSTVAFGFVLLFIAVVFESSLTITQGDPVLAGMFGVFGISSIVGAGSFYVVLKIIQRR
ncbi:hypothetical protein [Natronorubrum halophilum]|uniref:hypothetical protein n=1 Tax=Natronorubrum halophilum TaxID=1702106 RepID=UPI0010C23EAE|nr:hypothetical protein [Natronorubrum halophilum]